MDLRKIVMILFLILILSILCAGIDIPLEDYLDNYTEGNVTVFEYYAESIEVRVNVSNKTYVHNYPQVNSTEKLGKFKFKSINRLLYLNETNYTEAIHFIFTLRQSHNITQLEALASNYNLEFDIVLHYSENDSSELPFPPDSSIMNKFEELVAYLEEAYNDNPNFTFSKEYHSVKARGNISDIINLLYDNVTYSIDPGPYDLISDYPNSSFIPTSYLYYEYTNFTSCNDSLRTSSNDADGDLFCVCEDDCNDSNADIHPGADELWDGIDNDCDGETDEGFANCTGIDPPYSGDWNITSNTSCIDGNIILPENSNLNVIGNVTLSFENVTLVLEDGELMAYDGGGSNGIIDSIVDTIIDWVT